MKGFSWLALVCLVVPVSLAQSSRAEAATGGVLVTVGSPPTPFSQNKQNEPALAVDANNPSILVAGSNDQIDDEACNAGDPTTCPFTPGVGVSGVYFSFDSGATWTQPTYTGLTGRDCLGPDPCTPHVGPIGTLPGYDEAGLVSDGDPAVAFGPRPDAQGHFSWANGERLYYANLTSNLNSGKNASLRGFEGVAVSRTDDLQGAAAGNNSAWMSPVVVTKQNATLFSDKEQVWADNAATSPYFGHVYVCSVAFRSNSHGNAAPSPLVVATSTDGGTTWKQQQLTPAADNPTHSDSSGCTVRTDSHGVAYVFVDQFAYGLPGYGWHMLMKSYDGGMTWSRPQPTVQAVDTCNAYSPVIGRCVEDGIAGARDDLSSAPSVDIANGAPSGTDATNEILDTWVDGRDGLNNEHVMVTSSTDGGATWSTPQAVERTGDRGYYSAVGISPNGTDAYLVYNAFLTPYQNDTTSARSLEGVVLHSDISSTGTPTGWSEIDRGVSGDPRASSQNNLAAEFLGDYVYAVATRTYGAAVWNDVRNAADCPAIDSYRQQLNDLATSGAIPQGSFDEDASDSEAGQDKPGGGSSSMPTPPAVNTDCPATFGNSDIYGGSYPDPTP